MPEDSTLLRAVKTLNPVPTGEVPVSATLREEIRARIDAEADTVPTADVVPRPISRPTRRILAGAAAAVLLLVGVFTLIPQNSPEAYASWTATPTELAPAGLEEMAELCPPSEIPLGQEMVEVTPTIAEQRGDYRMMLSVADAGYQWCFVMPDPEAEGGVQRGAEGVAWPPEQSIEPEGPGEVTFLEGGTQEPFPDLGPLTMAVGTAGSDVTSVRVTTADGSFADATVADGWWIVWFPGEVEFAGSLTVTTTDGEQTEVPAQSALG
ncbi:hypothetical protein [Ruania zhangjianzhongii]|uniref:hypothetical protein n=1 Tax=Ruania zhangjianzhongii TaxID=2603206 RepID=UPI0011CC41DE|nr:hypothetical protein [Ruania zhangjianzhongii]